MTSRCEPITLPCADTEATLIEAAAPGAIETDVGVARFSGLNALVQATNALSYHGFRALSCALLERYRAKVVCHG